MADRRAQLTILIVYPHAAFWSMGEGKGAPSFLLAPEGLARAGHRVVLVMPAGESGPGSLDFAGFEIRRYSGGPENVLENAVHGPVRRFARRLLTYLRYRRRAQEVALEVAREIRPDVVVGYDEHAAPVARVVGRALGIPNVSRFFGTYMLPYRTSAWRRLYHFVPAIAYRTPAAAWILTDDGSGCDEVARAFGAPEERIHFWRNGVDRALFRADRSPGPRPARSPIPARFGFPEGARVLLTMSRLVREKHVERIVRALPEVRWRCGDVCLLVLGEGPEQARLEREVERLGLGAAVGFPGAVARVELSAFLECSDLFVAASDRTNAANPTFEAMVFGLPVVLLDTGRTGRLVEDEVTGYLVQGTDPAALGEVLVRVLQDPGSAARVAQCAREWALVQLPTPEERQRLETEVIEAVVREARAR